MYNQVRVQNKYLLYWMLLVQQISILSFSSTDMYVQPTAIGCAVYLTSVVANKEGRVQNSLEIKPIFLNQSLTSSFNLDKLILLNANRE